MRAPRDCDVWDPVPARKSSRRTQTKKYNYVDSSDDEAFKMTAATSFHTLRRQLTTNYTLF
jgi:hypothetical protein